jgi:choline dehydrogenase
MGAEYDYVIIGGGTAGLTLAARLSEEPEYSVAVIEAGNFYQIDTPLLLSTPMSGVSFTGTSPTDIHPAIDWSFVTSPQGGANQRELHYASGKCLGGR